jgi:hypothetical protein
MLLPSKLKPTAAPAAPAVPVGGQLSSRQCQTKRACLCWGQALTRGALRQRLAADAAGGRPRAHRRCGVAPLSDARVLRTCVCVCVCVCVWHQAHPLRLAPSPRYPSGALAPAACARVSRGGRLWRRLALRCSGALRTLSPLLSVRRNRSQRLLSPQLRLVLGQPLLALVALRTVGASARAAAARGCEPVRCVHACVHASARTSAFSTTASCTFCSRRSARRRILAQQVSAQRTRPHALWAP